MGLTALVSQHEDHAHADATPFEHHVTPVPTQALARLDRFATASLLAASASRSCANQAATMPVSRSPVPPVAIPALPVRLTNVRPSGPATSVRWPLRMT